MIVGLTMGRYMRTTGPDPIQEARSLRSRLAVQERKVADLLFACRQTVNESRRIIKKSKSALVQLKVIRGHFSGGKLPR